MKIRHVIDESGVLLRDSSPEAVAEVIDAFLDRIDTARDRREGVARSTDLYVAPVMDGLDFYDLLYDAASPIDDVDRLRRLRIAVDRLLVWDETEALDVVRDLEVTIAGNRVYSPSVAYAHACRSLPGAVGSILFKSTGRRGIVDVQVGGEAYALHFIVSESDHTQLFRDAVTIENMDEAAFEANAPSAFPRLSWVSGVWRGIGDFKRPYMEHRQVLVEHLGVLNDVGADIFNSLSATQPDQISGHFGSHGVVASDENGRTKRDKEAKKDRTRCFQGEECVFWWHTKLLPETDRIHFLWRSSADGDESPGDIIVGIFTHHCHLPD